MDPKEVTKQAAGNEAPWNSPQIQKLISIDVDKVCRVSAPVLLKKNRQNKQEIFNRHFLNINNFANVPSNSTIASRVNESLDPVSDSE